MDINQAFPSKYIKAGDLRGQVAKVKISRVTWEDIGSDSKPIMYFEGKQKGLVLNRTNGGAIAAELGPETDNWIGAEIELFSMRVPFNGQQVDAVRVRVPRQGRPAAPSGILPNARDRARQADDWQAPPPNEAQTVYDDGLDDEIPF